MEKEREKEILGANAQSCAREKPTRTRRECKKAKEGAGAPDCSSGHTTANHVFDRAESKN